MKILMTADTVGGVWNYSLDLARALAKYDVSIELATMGRALSRSQRDEVALLTNLTVHESSYKLEWMNDPWVDVQKAGEWLLEIEQRVRPDLLHFNNFCHAALPFRAPKLVVGHSCVYSWWSAVRGGRPAAEWQRYHSEVRQGLASADAVVAPSQAMLDALIEHYGVQDGDVVPNGRDLTRAKPVGTKESFVFSVGRLWDEAKNLAALDRVAKQLAWPVFAAGAIESPDGAQQRYLNVESVGELSSRGVLDIYARAAIYALPARYEPFGLSVLEAAAHGCALVLGDIPSLRENWDGVAMFVDPSDHEDLQITINYLIRNDRQRRRLGERAVERSRSFSLERMGLLYMSLYGRLTGRKEIFECAS